jgi:hypothetical protein
MSERQSGPYDSIAGKWLALVERRRAFLQELGNSGRWRLYYTHRELLAGALREMDRVRDEWARLAGLMPPEREEVRWHGPVARSGLRRS